MKTHEHNAHMQKWLNKWLLAQGREWVTAPANVVTQQQYHANFIELAS